MNELLNRDAVFDLRSLDTLKASVKSDSSEGVRAVANQMEGLFVQMMLKSMRDASFKGGLLDSPQSNMFTSMYDQQISQEIAATGKLGLADLIVSQLTGEKVSSEQLTGGNHVELPGRLSRTVGNALIAGAEKVLPQAKAAMARLSEGSPAGSFISRMLAPAIEAERKSGIHHQLIIAQAALESGWGGKEIVTKDGKPSHNLFGIKATPNWKGERTEITTTEYIGGVKQKVKAEFRVYPSYAAALSDYTSLLSKNPRYKHVVSAPSPEIAAKALQSGGYATDPHYSGKLINIIQQVKNSTGQAISAYKNDAFELF